MFIMLAQITAVQHEIALSYNTVRGLYFAAIIFVRNIVIPIIQKLFPKGNKRSKQHCEQCAKLPLRGMFLGVVQNAREGPSKI